MHDSLRPKLDALRPHDPRPSILQKEGGGDKETSVDKSVPQVNKKSPDRGYEHARAEAMDGSHGPAAGSRERWKGVVVGGSTSASEEKGHERDAVAERVMYAEDSDASCLRGADVE